MATALWIGLNGCEAPDTLVEPAPADSADAAAEVQAEVDVTVDPCAECDDGNPCTADKCESGATCTHSAIAGCLPCVNADICADNNVCTNDSCTGGKCAHDPVTVETPCEKDGKKCTLDHCVAGKCKFSQPVPCGGGWCGSVCQEPAGTCVAPSPNVPCIAADACLANTHCVVQGSLGVCVGTAYTCSDGNPCTADTCTGSKQGCAFAPTADAALVCDDANPCTDGDKCAAGACKGAAKPCNDNNPCTSDSCTPPTGCVHTVQPGCKAGKKCGEGSDCDDGNACSTDLCSADAVCVHVAAPAGKSCDADGKQCTVDHCLGGECQLKLAVTCGNQGGCALTCLEPTATCGLAGDLQPCLDAQPCLIDPHCAAVGGAVQCVGKPKSCDDGNVCTADACDAKLGGCVAATLSTAATCSDGNACTVGDSCSAGSCVAGAAKSCDDGVACTTDSCDPAAGTCSSAVLVSTPSCASNGPWVGGPGNGPGWSMDAKTCAATQSAAAEDCCKSLPPLISPPLSLPADCTQLQLQAKGVCASGGASSTDGGSLGTCHVEVSTDGFVTVAAAGTFPAAKQVGKTESLATWPDDTAVVALFGLAGKQVQVRVRVDFSPSPVGMTAEALHARLSSVTVVVAKP